MFRSLLKATFALIITTQSFFLQSSEDNQNSTIRLDSNEFLSNPFVLDIVQDNDGFLWFATQNGLNRYDGKNSKAYFFDVLDKKSLSSDWITSLFLDSIGRLWATSPKGLHLYQAESDSFINLTLSGEQEYRIKSVKESADNRIWVNATNGQFSSISFDSLVPKTITIKSSIIQNREVVDFEFANNQLIFLLEDGSVYKLLDEMGNAELVLQGETKSKHSFSAIEQGDADTLWLLSRAEGITQLDLKQNKITNIDVCGKNANDISITTSKEYWVATDKGVCSFTFAKKGAVLSKTIPFSSPVNSLYQDNSENLWAGTYNGVFFWNISKKSFPTFSSKSIKNFKNHNVLAFEEDQSGSLLISSWGGGISKLKHLPDTDEYITNNTSYIDEFKDVNISTLHSNNDSSLYIGTFDKGLYKKSDDSQIAELIIKSNGQAVTTITKINDYNFAVSIIGQGVSFVDEKELLPTEFIKGFGVLVFALSVDMGKYLWTSSYDKGLSYLNMEQINFNSLTDMQTKTVNVSTNYDIQATSILISTQYIWAGTKDHGLLRIEKDSVYHSNKPELKFYNKRDGLASDFIYGILEDDYGNIWFSHDKGISRLDPTTDKVINFNETHGLQGTDFNSSAYYKDKHGRLYFGGANGFNAFTPDEVPINRHKPPLRLTKFSESNEEMPIHSKLREDGYLELKHNETILDFEFAALDFTRPQDNQYQYMMEGLTDKWVSLGTNNHLSFSHLPVGDYTLRVKGSNNDGVWSDELTIPIEVLPPIWRTWYAYLFYLTLVIGAIVLLIIQQREKLRAQLANEQRLHKLAYYDSLTGLPNRQSFYETLEKFLSLAKREHYRAGIVFIDLDRFKRINDTLGHDYGDKVLKEVAFRLQESVRESDMVVTSAEINQFDTELARLGGDEFTLFLSRLDSADEATMITQRIIDAVSEPIKLDEYEVSVTPSVGIAIYPENGETVSELMKHADIAMYQAKAEGRRTFKFYSDSLNEKALERLKLETELKGAIAAGQFELHYQPQVDIHNNQISKAEALVRWHHPELGMVSPAVFIPMAEESGLIIELGDWILEQACKDAKMWQEQLPNPCRVSVNVSSIQFKQSALVDKIENVLASTGLPANLLEIELTESAIMSDVEDNILRLQQIKNMGVAIACDDFGTGYSSLSYLKRFPLDTLKIDRSFIQDVTTDENDLVIVKAVMLLADTMNLKVVAEGVESIEQLEILHKYQCEYIQGYYFAKPLPLDDFILFVTKEFYEDKFMWELELLNSAPRLNS